uniref:Uncharacterized protein n=1 Tax=Salix viminalis TaxID=40686 RepID=A0A6N2MNA6_SALVM
MLLCLYLGREKVRSFSLGRQSRTHHLTGLDIFNRLATSGMLHFPLCCLPILLLVLVTLQHWALQKSHTGLFWQTLSNHKT